jgi:hypothetical protein
MAVDFLRPGVDVTQPTTSQFLRNPPSSCVQPGTHVLLNSLNIFDPKILGFE